MFEPVTLSRTERLTQLADRLNYNLDTFYATYAGEPEDLIYVAATVHPILGELPHPFLTLIAAHTAAQRRIEFEPPTPTK